jgi:hypothetical protein
MGSESYHEPYERLSPATRDMHRALTSLMEELEAIDWYGQRAEVCEDDELRAVLLHNRGEEIEHAMMVLEWIRRREPLFDKNIGTYLRTQGPITSIEKKAESEEATNEAIGESGGGGGAAGGGGGGGLGIGSLRKG